MAYTEELDFSDGAEEEEEEEEEEEDEDEEEDEEDDDEVEHERPVKEARKDAVYNTTALHEKLEDMGWPEDVEWLQSLAVVYPQDSNAVDVDDDLAREMSFYTQALEGAKQAYQKFEALGIPFRRPTDYYAEMVKTDTHMLKIKDKLLHEKSQLEGMDERRKSRESKKFAKEVQAEKMKERSKRKKNEIESVKKWRKVRQKSGFTEGGEDGPPIDFDTGGSSRGKREDGKTSSRGRGTGRGRGRGRSEPSKNRQFRDSKYGNSGRRSDKRNNADSSADDSSFRGSFKGEKRGGMKGRGGGRFSGASGGRGKSRGGGAFRGRGRGKG